MDFVYKVPSHTTHRWPLGGVGKRGGRLRGETPTVWVCEIHVGRMDPKDPKHGPEIENSGKVLC